MKTHFILVMIRATLEKITACYSLRWTVGSIPWNKLSSELKNWTWENKNRYRTEKRKNIYVCEERRIEMNFLKTRVNAQFQECGIHGQVRVFECDNSDGSNDGSGLCKNTPMIALICPKASFSSSIIAHRQSSFIFKHRSSSPPDFGLRREQVTENKGAVRFSSEAIRWFLQSKCRRHATILSNIDTAPLDCKRGVRNLVWNGSILVQQWTKWLGIWLKDLSTPQSVIDSIKNNSECKYLGDGGSAFGAGFGRRGFTLPAIDPLLQIVLVVENLKIGHSVIDHLTHACQNLQKHIAIFDWMLPKWQVLIGGVSVCEPPTLFNFISRTFV